jgi:hypothetical protein
VLPWTAAERKGDGGLVKVRPAGTLLDYALRHFLMRIFLIESLLSPSRSPGLKILSPWARWEHKA